MQRKEIHLQEHGLGYAHVEENGLIAYSNADANTNHANKLVRGTARKTKLKNKIDIRFDGQAISSNEVAFYRRTRDHSLREDENKTYGGKRILDMFVTEVENPYLSEEDKEIMRQHNIPIIYINVEKYKLLDREENNLQEEKNEGER